MGSVFAVQVKTGSEIMAKEMLELVFQKANDTLVKSIYALETHTRVIETGMDSFDQSDDFVQSQISEHLEKKELRTRITNKRRQLEVIERYNTEEYNELKKEYKSKINALEKEFKQLSNSKTKIKSVISGYILVELVQNSTYLPNHLWSLIKSVPLVNRILSVNPIPEDELEYFATCLEESLEPQVEVALNKELDYDKLIEKESKLLSQINAKETNKDEENRLLEKLDELRLSVVEKVRTLIEQNKTNPFLDKIRCFVRRKKEVVSMPFRYLEELYADEEIRFIGERINAKDFLERLENKLGNREVLQC